MNNTYMGINKKLAVASFGILLSLGLFASSAVKVHAQGQFSVTAFPAVIDQKVEPNSTNRVLVQFKNNTNGPIAGTIKVANYTITDKLGTPTLITDPTIKVKYAAASWITPDQAEITIPANNYVAVNLTIQTPNELSTCGNYALAYFEYDALSQPGSTAGTQSATSIAAKVGSLINLSTNNKKCVEKVTVSHFDTPTFLEFGPVKTAFELQNMGDIHEAPVGKIVLKDMFNTVVDEQPIKSQRIFPESIKAYENSIGSKWLFGRFAVELQAKYGLSSIPLVYTAYLWIMPWRLMVAILLALIIVTIIIKNTFGKMSHKEHDLEHKLEKEEEEITQLKKMLRDKKE